MSKKTFWPTFDLLVAGSFSQETVPQSASPDAGFAVLAQPCASGALGRSGGCHSQQAAEQGGGGEGFAGVRRNHVVSSLSCFSVRPSGRVVHMLS
jgi:hypothetical protein